MLDRNDTNLHDIISEWILDRAQFSLNEFWTPCDKDVMALIDELNGYLFEDEGDKTERQADEESFRP